MFGALQNLRERGSSKVKFDKIIIPARYKSKILRELNLLNINEMSLFPEIERTSKHITSEYESESRDADDAIDDIL